LDKEDPGFAYAVWSDADEQYDSWMKEAIASMEVDSQGEGKKEFHCYEEAWELEAKEKQSREPLSNGGEAGRGLLLRR